MIEHLNRKSTCRLKIYGVLIILFAILFTAVIVWFIGSPLVRFASDPEMFRQWVNSHGICGKLAYMSMVCLQVVVAVIPGEPFEIVAGYAFGAILGTVLCITAQTAGSLIVFWFVHRFGFHFTDLFFRRETISSLRFLKSTPKRDFFFFVIFMIPGTPKDLLCYFAGFTDMKLVVWLLISFIGRVPSVITSTIGGNALSTKSYIIAVVVFLITVAVSTVGLFIYRQIIKSKNK